MRITSAVVSPVCARFVRTSGQPSASVAESSVRQRLRFWYGSLSAGMTGACRRDRGKRPCRGAPPLPEGGGESAGKRRPGEGLRLADGACPRLLSCGRLPSPLPLSLRERG